MKKTLLAAAVFALLGTSAQGAAVYEKDGTSLDVFGRIQASFMNHRTAHVKNSEYNSGNDNTIGHSIRFGAAGRSQLTDGIYAIGFYESEVLPKGGSEDSLVNLRYAYAGIDAQQYGTLTAGRGDSAYYTVAGATDIFNEMDSRANEYYAMGDQFSGQIMYSLSAMGWDLRLSGQFAQDNLNDTFNVESGFAFAMATRLAHDVSIAYGFDFYELDYEASGRDGAMFGHFKTPLAHVYEGADDDFLWSKRPRYRIDKGAAVSWGILGQGLYAALLCQATKYSHFSHHIYTWEFASNYTFDCGIALEAGYAQQRYNGGILVQDLTLGVSYKPVPQFKIFAETQLDLNAHPEKLYDETWIERYAYGQNLYMIGAEYDF